MSLSGTNNASCVIDFIVKSSLPLHIKPKTCSVLLYGCPEGYRVDKDEYGQVDTCKECKLNC